MSENSTQKEIIVQRIPLPWAVTLTALIALPFGFFLGKFNFTVWVAFVVWAEYFVFGATPSNWKLIIPSLPFGAAAGLVWCAAAVALMKLGLSPYLSFSLSAIVMVTLYLYIHVNVKRFMEASLASFNGFTMYLAVYFTGSMPKVGPIENPYWVLLWVFIWTTLMLWFGWFMGWLNIFLTFPKKVSK